MARINAKPSAPRQAVYRQRRQAGLQPMVKPWDWLSLAEVQKLAVEAYRSATFALSDPEDQTSSPHEYFVGELARAFEVLVAGKAQGLGLTCAPANAKHYAQCLREDVPANWRPQYPVYKQLTPASVCGTPGVLTNADEGNVNGIDCKS